MPPTRPAVITLALAISFCHSTNAASNHDRAERNTSAPLRRSSRSTPRCHSEKQAGDVRLDSLGPDVMKNGESPRCGYRVSPDYTVLALTVGPNCGTKR